METQKEMNTTVDTATTDRVVWQFLDGGINMDPAEFESKYSQLQDEFINNKLKDWGEFLHSAGVLLHYSKLGVLPHTEKEILETLRKKVKDYASHCDFDPLPNSVFSIGGWGGRAIPEMAHLKAAGIIDCILAEQGTKLARALRAEFLEYTNNINSKDTLLELCEHIKHSEETDSKFFIHPVFATLSEEERIVFFKAVIEHDVRNIQHLLISLQQRYNLNLSDGKMDKNLLSEKSFIESFNAYAKKKLKEEERIFNPGIEKYEYVIALLRPILDEFKRAEDNK